MLTVEMQQTSSEEGQQAATPMGSASESDKSILYNSSAEKKQGNAGETQVSVFRKNIFLEGTCKSCGAKLRDSCLSAESERFCRSQELAEDPRP